MIKHHVTAAEDTDSPSTWRKPSDIMRLRRKRKSSTNINLRRQSESSPASSPNTPTELPPWKRPGQKRRNPFGCSPRKRAHVEVEHSDGEGNMQPSSLFGGLDGVVGEDKEQVPPSNQRHMSNLDNILTESLEKTERKVPKPADQEEQPSSQPQGEKSCPIDWSLKTKVRFTSPNPFSWCNLLKTTEESSGLVSHTHNLPDSVCSQVDDPSRCEKSKREFQKHLLYWQHPNLPWFRLCPRIVPDNKIGSESFMSAFNQLRGGRCPYFYMCAHSFTVLFRAGGVGGRPMMHAILTPTSRGFREMLKKEGIEFAMPLMGNISGKQDLPEGKTSQIPPTDETVKEEAQESIKTESSEIADGNEDDDDIMTTDDGATSFLADLGLDAARYRSLDPTKIKLQRETYKVIDHRPESTILVDGGDTNALFNFLLNCRSCVASSGIQTGIPPTLLSPVPFKGATMKCLKYKTGSVRRNVVGSNNAHVLWHSLEVEGAILPHTIQGLSTLLSHTQHHFHTTCSSHDATAPLNATLADGDHIEDEITAIDSLRQSGVQLNHIENLVKESPLGKMVLRDMEYKDGLFTWDT